MHLVIILFGALTLLTGLAIIFNPESIFGALDKNIDMTGLRILAVLVRLLPGATLIYLAELSRWPLVIEVLGWLAIVAALALGGMGRKNFIRLMSWALSLQNSLGRIGGLIAASFGAFLIYAFV